MVQDSNYHSITERILGSKKYRTLYPKTVARIVKDAFDKYGVKRAEKEARKKLHQIWGAYWKARPNFDKLLEKFGVGLKEGRGVQESLLPILALQSSTKERIPFLDQFYERIFKLTGTPDTIIDHACGLNPLTFPWMKLSFRSRYFGFDIDKEQIRFLSEVFELLGLGSQVKVTLEDILIDKSEYADIVFMLKLLPLLEQQQKGSSLKVLKELKCNYLVVSFPVKTLSGKEKGMKGFYSGYFEKLVANASWKISKINFDTEVVFVIQK